MLTSSLIFSSSRSIGSTPAASSSPSFSSDLALSLLGAEPVAAARMRCMAACTSSSVSVRSGAEREAQRHADLALRHALALIAIELADGTSVAGAADRMVPRTVSADKVSSTRIETSRTTDGKRGSGSTRSAAAGAPADSTRGRFRHVHSSPAGMSRASATAGASRPRRRRPGRHRDGGRAAGHQVGALGDGEGRGDAERRARLFDHALHVEEVHVAPRAAPVIAGGRAGPRQGQRRRSPRRQKPCRFRRAARRAGRDGGCG